VLQKIKLGARWSALTSRYSIYLIMIGMVVVSSILSPAFLSETNFSNISRQISITTILAFGQTILIICGMIDLAPKKFHAGSASHRNSGLPGVAPIARRGGKFLRMFSRPKSSG